MKSIKLEPIKILLIFFIILINKEIDSAFKSTALRFINKKEACKIFSLDPNKPIIKETLKDTYKKLVQENHPDIGGCKKNMTEINNAYDFLKKHLKDNSNNTYKIHNQSSFYKDYDYIYTLLDFAYRYGLYCFVLNVYIDLFGYPISEIKEKLSN